MQEGTSKKSLQMLATATKKARQVLLVLVALDVENQVEELEIEIRNLIKSLRCRGLARFLKHLNAGFRYRIFRAVSCTSFD